MRTIIIALLTIVSCLGNSGRVGATEIRLLTTGAMKSVVLAMLPGFEKSQGHSVSVDSDTAGGLNQKILGGQTFDVAILTPALIDRLITAKLVVAGRRVDLAKVGIGVAVKAGAAKPDISTVEAFKRTLLAATSVTYVDPKAGGSSGIYFDQLIERLGLAQQVRAKARLLPGGYVAELVAKGEVELAVHQISEIVPVEGVVLVGPLPAEIQNTTIYSAGLGAKARDAAAAAALIAYLAGPEATAVLQAKGLEKP